MKNIFTEQQHDMFRSIFRVFLRLFYKHIDGANPYHVLCSVFFIQKIVGINRMISWPAAPSSKFIYPWNITVGRRTFPGFSPFCYIQARNGIVIGNNFRMGPGCGLISANHRLDDYDKHTEGPPIKIGDNVWLGMNVIVLPGVTIGSNVVVGAGSLVATDIPSNTIATGNPCKVIKTKEPYLGEDYSS